jgi:hypothetical protein
MTDTMMIRTIALGVAGTAAGAAVMLAPRSASADRHGPRCEAVSGRLEEDPGGAASCPAGHPGCFIGAVDGHKLHATTVFFAEGAAAAPPASPGWFSYSGVTTYTMQRGTLITRETRLFSNFAIPEAALDGGGASLSMEVITGGTGELAGATGYLFVTGFIDDNNHVSSSVAGQLCTP